MAKDEQKRNIRFLVGFVSLFKLIPTLILKALLSAKERISLKGVLDTSNLGKETNMRLNFQTRLHDIDVEHLCPPSAKAEKTYIAKPRKNPDVAQIRKKVVARYSKTLAYLAK